MELTVYGPLRGVTGSKTLSIPAVDDKESVQAVLERFVEQYPRAEAHLFDEHRALYGSVRILVDGERADPETTVSSAADLSVIPAAKGG